MKVMSIVGTRPQLVKLAEISKAKDNLLNHIILHTGQHYDSNMSESFFEELSIPEPDYNLNVGSGNHAVQTSKMMEGIDEIIIQECPDYVLLYGDTNTTLAGAIVASKYSEIKIGHVESGLRSYNRSMPEEINRVVTDHLSHHLFCPTLTSVNNLKEEGITNGVNLTGDVMCDSISNNQLPLEGQKKLLRKYNLRTEDYILLTLHRPQNVDDPEILTNLIDSFSRINHTIFWPIHPRTKKNLRKFGIQSLPRNVIIVQPRSYVEIICLIKNSLKVLTDSGGLQKEAYILERPCVTIRTETEWIETLENGWNVLVGLDHERLVENANNVISRQKHNSFYGDGSASKKIINIMARDI